jgi:hypothetical protein
MIDRPTDPAPSDPEAKLGQQLAELELAVARVGECMGRVMRTVQTIKMSQLTAEHTVRTIREAKRNDRLWLVDLERKTRADREALEALTERVRELESTAAE